MYSMFVMMAIGSTPNYVDCTGCAPAPAPVYAECAPAPKKCGLFGGGKLFGGHKKECCEPAPVCAPVPMPCPAPVVYAPAPCAPVCDPCAAPAKKKCGLFGGRKAVVYAAPVYAAPMTYSSGCVGSTTPVPAGTMMAPAPAAMPAAPAPAPTPMPK